MSLGSYPKFFLALKILHYTLEFKNSKNKVSMPHKLDSVRTIDFSGDAIVYEQINDELDERLN